MKLNNESKPSHPSNGVQEVVILGGGSAGLLAAIAMGKHLPNIRVVVVRSKRLGVIGVGEGTIATIGRFLHDYLELDVVDFHQQVHPSIKLGIQFKWGSETPYHYTFSPQFSATNPAQNKFSGRVGYLCQSDATYASLAASFLAHGNVATLGRDGKPTLPAQFSYHLENKRFVDYLERQTDQMGIEKIDAIVDQVEMDEGGVRSLSLDNGQNLKADLYLDCSGFRSELLGKALAEPFVSFKDALLCDRAVVGGWTRTDEPYNPFTTAEAMEAGWSWQIEHDEIINRGYVYSSDFISDDAAESEFRRKNPCVVDTRTLRFESGAYRRSWVKNVVALGNASGFVEPLEATAIAFISSGIDQLVALLRTGAEHIQDIHRDLFNEQQEMNWIQTRDFLALHYQPNQLGKSSFWDACRNDIPLGTAQEILDYYQIAGPDFHALQTRLKGDIFGAEGYLSMLVGQKVPYRQKVEFSESEKDRWKNLRLKWATVANRGITMHDYLAGLRSGEFEIGNPRSIKMR